MIINDSNTEQNEKAIIHSDVARVWPELYDGRAIKVPNGDSLIRRFGPDESGLCFIINDDNKHVKWKSWVYRVDCVADYWMEIIDGEFWISKAGTSCFRPSDKGKHRLIAFNHDTFIIAAKDDIIKMNMLYIKKTKEKVFVILKKEENNND